MADLAVARLPHASRLRATLTGLALLVVVTAAAAEGDLEQLRQQVEDTERAFAETMARRDHDAFRTFLAEEAVFFSGADGFVNVLFADVLLKWFGVCVRRALRGCGCGAGRRARGGLLRQPARPPPRLPFPLTLSLFPPLQSISSPTWHGPPAASTTCSPCPRSGRWCL